jgi:hypothetical protein
MDIIEICINTMNWVDSSQDRDYCECGIVPPGSISHERDLEEGLGIDGRTILEWIL